MVGTATEYTQRLILAELEEGLPVAAHHLTHENGASDEIDLTSLSGVLADKQDAGKLQGRTLASTAPSDGQAVVWDDGNSQWEPGVPAVAFFYDAYVCLRDKKAQNTHGGAFTSGAWRTRDITDEQADAQAICSIATNQITLAAGTYRCVISCPAYRVNSHQTRLYNITDSAVLLVGTSEFAFSTDDVITRSFIAGRFTLAAQKVLEIQHYCSETKTTSGFGNAANITDEIYTIVEFWREA